MAALATTDDPKLADLLLVDWKGYSPSIRNAILDTLLSRTAWTSSLLSSLEDGCVPPGRDRPGAASAAAHARDSARLKSRAEAVFAHQSQPRQAVVDAYRRALAIKGDRAAGAAVFKKLCASCHRLGNEGVEVGPDLAGSERQVARGPLDRHPRPQPGVRDEISPTSRSPPSTAAS